MLKNILLVTLLTTATYAIDRFSNEAEGLVKDNLLKVEWLTAINENTAHSNAQTYCSRAIKNGSGFRLPTAQELISLARDSQLAAIAFQTSYSGSFWSSSRDTSQLPNNMIFAVALPEGTLNSQSENTNFNALCVRDKQ